jgi:hypothetical protein
MEPIREQSFQPPLTLDMIEPTPDNKIPPNGISLRHDDKLGHLSKNFRDNPQDPDARLEYLRYIAQIGDVSSAKDYLSIINSPKSQRLSGELRLKETELLVDLFMNAAEAAKRRNEYWKRMGGTARENPLEYLELSLRYKKVAEKLREKLKKEKQSK